MGHGDEIILADAHFPGETFNQNVIRADGLKIAPLLEGIMPLFILDQYVDNPIAMMAAVPGEELDPTVEDGYVKAIHTTWLTTLAPERVDRFSFYSRASSAYELVIPHETPQNGNIILKKGDTPC